jgi:hypothetical protein
VTDSTGKKLLWEKQTPVRYKSDAGKSARCHSVCATDDGGFTVAGELVLNDSLGGHNALAAHFVATPVTAIIPRNNATLKPIDGIHVRVAGGRLTVSNLIVHKGKGSVSLFDISGRRIAVRTIGSKEASSVSFDISNLPHGTYFFRAGAAEETGKFVITPARRQ